MKTENFSEENECINKFFDDEFLVKILRKKDPETVRRIIEEILIIRFIKKKGSQFINKILIRNTTGLFRHFSKNFGKILV